MAEINETSAEREEVSEEKFTITAKAISGEAVSGKITADIELEKEESALVSFFKKIINTITGRVIEVIEQEEVQEEMTELCEIIKVLSPRGLFTFVKTS